MEEAAVKFTSDEITLAKRLLTLYEFEKRWIPGDIRKLLCKIVGQKFE